VRILLWLLLFTNIIYGQQYALQFNGTSHQVLFGNTVPALGRNFTVECFFKWLRGTESWQAILERQQWGSQEWGIIIGGPGSGWEGNVEGAYTYDGNHNNANYISSAQSTVSSGTWHHVALVGANTNIYLYVDGQRVASNSLTGPLGAVPNVEVSAGSLMNPYEFFCGVIDEVRISNIPRYTGTTYQVPTQEFVTDTNTLALWHFNEGTGTTTSDASGNGHNGTLVNNPTWVTGYFSSTGTPTQTITVTAPNGGETWTAGTTQTVTWTSQGSVGNVNIDLSTNGGTNWTTLVSNTANDGSEAITVPNTPSTQCRIRVQEPDGSPSDMSNNNFTIVAAPAITVTAPNGGETWTVGTTQTVTWTSQGSVGNVNIDLSTNGGTNWTTLVSNTGNDGSEAITVPNTPSSTCRIRVQEPDGSPSDTSDNNFTISVVTPAITVTAPNGGETWTAGTTQTVTWTSSGTVGSLNIDLSTNGGTNWTTLVSNTANDGSEAITVPNTPSTQCRIRVQEPDGSPSDTSNNNFTIAPAPAITVTAPNGGETWTVGTTQTVTWTSQGSVGNVNIDLSTDGGTNWTNLVSNTANDGSEAIPVPNTPSTQCRIRVQEPDGSPTDTSDSNFTITAPPQPTITVTSPNGGETWTAGTTQTVAWTSQGSVGNANIDLSTDGGTNWTTLVSNTANDGSEAIPVPNTPSTQCRIRVQEPDGSPTDTSDSNFTISAPPSITVTAPNGGETWIVGTTQTVTWTSQGITGTINIDLSTDGGSTWQNLAAGITDDGSEAVTVPDVPSTTCRIKVSEADGTPSDTSDADFSIIPPEQPIITVSVTTLDFGKLDPGAKKTMKFNITNTGTGTLTGSITSSKTWAKVSPTSFNISASNSATINVTVDNTSTGLNKITGSYTAVLTVKSNGGADQLINIKLTATCVLVKPNPYNPNKGLLTFFGSGIVPKNTEIRIYTLDGSLVKTLTEKAGRDEIDWDGMNEQGEKIVDGIYLYIYESPTEKGIGKFTIKK